MIELNFTAKATEVYKACWFSLCVREDAVTLSFELRNGQGIQSRRHPIKGW
jgi:hypothetical protein